MLRAMRISSLFLLMALASIGCGGSDSGSEVPATDSGSGDTRSDVQSDGTSADSITDSGSETASDSAADTVDTVDSGIDTGTTKDGGPEVGPKKDTGADVFSDCPPTTPTVGTPCAPEGLKCPYGSFTVCFCTAGKWECAV